MIKDTPREQINYAIFSDEEAASIYESVKSTNGDVIPIWRKLVLSDDKNCSPEDIEMQAFSDSECFNLIMNNYRYLDEQATESERIMRLKELWVSQCPESYIFKVFTNIWTEEEIHSKVRKHHLEELSGRVSKVSQLQSNKVFTESEENWIQDQYYNSIEKFGVQISVPRLLEKIKSETGKTVHINTLRSLLKELKPQN